LQAIKTEQQPENERGAQLEIRDFTEVQIFLDLAIATQKDYPAQGEIKESSDFKKQFVKGLNEAGKRQLQAFQHESSPLALGIIAQVAQDADLKAGNFSVCSKQSRGAAGDAESSGLRWGVDSGFAC
jgi:hypothetical protein